MEIQKRGGLMVLSEFGRHGAAFLEFLNARRG